MSVDDHLEQALLKVDQLSLMATGMLESAHIAQRALFKLRVAMMQEEIKGLKAHPLAQPQTPPEWDWAKAFPVDLRHMRHTIEPGPAVPMTDEEEDLRIEEFAAQLAAFRAGPPAFGTPTLQVSPAAQDEGAMVKGQDGSDECAQEGPGEHMAAQSEQFVESAGEEGGEEHGAVNTASEPTSPAADGERSVKDRVLDIYAREDVSHSTIGNRVSLHKDQVRRIIDAHLTDDRVIMGKAMRGEGKKYSVGDKALDLYASSILSISQIAKQIGSTDGSVSGFLGVARAKRDPRAEKGRQLRIEARAAQEEQEAKAAEARKIEQAAAEQAAAEQARIAAGNLIHVDPTRKQVFNAKRDTAIPVAIPARLKIADLLSDGEWHTYEALKRAGNISFASVAKMTTLELGKDLAALGVAIRQDEDRRRVRMEALS